VGLYNLARFLVIRRIIASGLTNVSGYAWRSLQTTIDVRDFLPKIRVHLERTIQRDRSRRLIMAGLSTYFCFHRSVLFRLRLAERFSNGPGLTSPLSYSLDSWTRCRVAKIFSRKRLNLNTARHILNACDRPTSFEKERSSAS